jgi:ABC-type lipoprotein export system ATPase subunit
LAIESVNVTKAYGEDTILEGVSLKIHSGASLAISGASGCGKSTLLSLFGLLLQPTAGEILFRGRKTSELTDNERAGIRNGQLGFVFQNPQLIGTLSVLDNVLVPARLARRRDLRSKAERLLEYLGLDNRLEHLPHRLSVGQKRRVAIARALLLDPAVVLADEPTNDLDPELAARVSDILFDLPPAGKALVVVTHDECLARRASRRVRICDGMVSDSS